MTEHHACKVHSECNSDCLARVCQEVWILAVNILTEHVKRSDTQCVQTLLSTMVQPMREPTELLN